MFVFSQFKVRLHLWPRWKLTLVFIVVIHVSSCFIWVRNLFYHSIVNVKLSPWLNWALRHEDILGSGGIAPRILDIGAGWRWVVAFMPLPLYPQGKSPWYPLDRRLCGPQSRFGHGGEEKNFQPLPGLEHPIIQPVALSYPGSWCVTVGEEYEGVSKSLRTESITK
jgi:hypothetical protein